MTSTEFIAWWGALTGTAALGIKIVEHLADKPKVRSEAQMARRYDPQRGKRLCIDISVRNLGRRVAKIESVWVALLRNKPNGRVDQAKECQLVDGSLVAFQTSPKVACIELGEG